MQAEKDCSISLPLMFTKVVSIHEFNADLKEMQEVGLLCAATTRLGNGSLPGPKKLIRSFYQFTCLPASPLVQQAC